MKQIIFASLAMIAALVAMPTQTLAQGGAFESSGSQYPSMVEQNQFGETFINKVKAGSSNQIDCNFIVDSTNGNGLGIRNLKGPGCAAVYMHTSSTPAAGNPNPAAGYIVVQLTGNYGGYLGGYHGYVSPLSGSSINVTSGLTAGLAYVVTAVGTTTPTNWATLGVPAGVTAAPGVPFIAITSSAGSGTGTVQVPVATGSGTLDLDVVGDTNLAVAGTAGSQVILRVLGATNSSTTTLVATAPANNTVIGLRFSMLPLASQLH
jgi:hypothetical protein